MRTIKASEFKAKCLKLMDEIAQNGEVLEITKNGKPVARLVPARSARPKLLGLHEGQVQVLGDVMVPAVDPADWELDADQPELYEPDVRR
jgi:prevent-host-death family protein